LGKNENDITRLKNQTSDFGFVLQWGRVKEKASWMGVATKEKFQGRARKIKLWLYFKLCKLQNVMLIANA
jgi:hypothetical protein